MDGCIAVERDELIDEIAAWTVKARARRILIL